MDELYLTTNKIFKKLRDAKWLHQSISRRKASRAIRRVLEQQEEGDVTPPSASLYPHLSLFFKKDKQYSSKYVRLVLGVYRYLRGDYIGKKNEV